MGHLETCCEHQSTEELRTWTGHFIGTSRGHSNYVFHYNQSYFIQACVPLPFVIAIGNLQFNKTSYSVTCINCKLYTCLNSSISLRHDSLLILPSRRSLWLPVNLQRPWEEGPMAGLVSRLLQFCVTPVHFNHSAYNWEQIKFHLQDIHNNASLNVQLLQKEIFETFSKPLPSSTNLETLAEQLADQLSGLDPHRWFQSITHSIGSGTVILVIVLIVIFVIYRCLHAKIV